MFYRGILSAGIVIILITVAMTAIAVHLFIPNLRTEAGTDVMLNQADPDLAYYNASRVYWNATDEYVIFCCTRDDWFTEDGLKALLEFVAEARRLPHCRSITAITTIPLLRVKRPGFLPSVTSLESADFFIDDKKGLTPEQKAKRLELARTELVEHTHARGNLISPNARDVSILANLDIPAVIEELEPRRNVLHGQKRTPEVQRELDAIEPRYREGIAELNVRRKALVDKSRELVSKWSPRMVEPIRVAGIPILNRNIIEHVDDDVATFSIVSLAAFLLAFVVIYRRLRWVVLPILACVMPVVIVLGAMVLTDSRMTVITSNLPILTFILTLPYAIYLVERYRERRTLYPDEDGPTVVSESARDIWIPCLYSATTTMAGTASLITSGIIPVKTFGLMATAGMAFTLFSIFLFLAACFRLLAPIAVKGAGTQSGVIPPLRPVVAAVLKAPAAVIFVGLGILGVAIWGTTKVTAETKVIDYFWPKSETYVGLKYVDERLGGTTPLEIMLKSSKGHWRTKEGLETLDRVAAFFKDVPETGNVRTFKTLVDEIKKAMPKSRDEQVVGFLIAMTGRKVEWKCATCGALKPEGVKDTGEREPRIGDTREAACAVCKKPTSWRVERIDVQQVGEFCSWDFSVSRILVRMKETAPTLNRKRILDALAVHLNKPEFAHLEERRPTGVFLLYSNLLQDLLQSQKDTFLMVLIAIWMMLVILFVEIPGIRKGLASTLVIACVAAAEIALGIVLWRRGSPLVLLTETGWVLPGLGISIGLMLVAAAILTVRREGSLAHGLAATLGWAGRTLGLPTIVLVPQVLPVFIVLGIMGFFHIALDMVTTMIASMAMGVGIDAAIQYTVRYRIELDATGDPGEALRRSHATIGRSILIATSIVFAGFLVLGFSKFVPTVWFGLFTGLAMLMGLFASLTILPSFFVLLRFPKPRQPAAPAPPPP